MAQTAFEITYDGPGLANGRMPVRELAPALLALGDVFAEASVVLYPERKPAALSVKATDDGSFVVLLILESVWDEVMDIFTSDAVQAIINLRDVVVGGGYGLYRLVKYIRGRNIVEREQLPEPGMIRITLADGDTIEVPSQVLALYDNVSIRKHARRVVEPLAGDDVDALRFRTDDEVTVELRSEDLPAFEPPDDVEIPLGETDITMVVSLASVAFTEGNKWRLSDGDQTFYASIEDTEFLASVEQGEPFRKGDMLRCVVRLIQSQRDDGLHTDRVVERVLEHIPRPTQLRLDDRHD